MLNKDKEKEQLESLANVFSINELVERLILIEKVEKGSAQSPSGQVISDADLDKEIGKWFK